MAEAIPSPFPHMQAMAAAGAAAEAAKAKKEDEQRELIKQTCWCAGICVACFVGAILTFQLFEDRLSVRPRTLFDGREAGIVRKVPDLAAVPGKFFVEIGSSQERMESAVGGKHLESLGWGGVCALPLPTSLSQRTCKVIALPVAGKDGVKVRVPDCSGQTSGIKALTSKLFKVTCPHVSATTVSIAGFLKIADAPKVIDYVSLDNQDYLGTQITNLDIVRHFPHTERCVRAWSIHGASIESIKNVLEVGQGCKVHSTGGNIFARCPCTGQQYAEGANISHATTPTASAPKHAIMRSIQTPDTSKQNIQIHPSGGGQSRKGSVVVNPK